jgi:hypothetical protein
MNIGRTLGVFVVCLASVASRAAPDPIVPTPPSPPPPSRRCPTDVAAGRIVLPAALRTRVNAPKKTAWEKARGGQVAAIPHIKDRLRGWPERLLVDRHSLPQTDDAFAKRVAHDTWRGLDALSDREHGLPVDTVRFGAESVDIATARIGDYASGTDIGLHLTAVVAARELGFLPAAAAVDRLRRTLATVAGLAHYRGLLFNYYDTTSLERTSNFVSFIDTAWLTAGLMVVRAAVPELAPECTRLIDRQNLGFFYDREHELVSHGYYVHPGRVSPFHYGMFYTEARLGYLIGIGKGELPADLWFAMTRTFPADCGIGPPPLRVRRRTVLGHSVESGECDWRGVRYVPSWGGSMFEALMPTLLLDELRHAPDGLGANDRAHVAVQRRYATEELHMPVWGLSPCTTPDGGGYGEYGAPMLGVRGYAAGPVTPHASALALAVAPEAALANLRALAERYDVYGDYGFYDAVDPATGRVAHTYLALDQSMLFLALANHLCAGCVQQHFAADPIVRKILPLVQAERFFD